MKTSGTMNSATGHTSVSTRTGNFNDGLYDKAGARPDLDLDFARTKSLKDRVSKEDLITYTRTTSSDGSKGATYIDENGLVKVASRNLISRSETVTSGGYGPTVQIDGTSNTYTDNNVIAPDGSLTAGTWTGDSDSFAILYGRTDGTNAWIRSPQLYTSSAVGWNITSEWQRFYYAFTYPSDGNGNIVPYPLRDEGGGSIYFSGVSNLTAGSQYTYSAYYKKVGTKVYYWGGQINLGSTPTEYVRTQGIASGAPRFTHDPITKESKGLLIEQAATNFVTSSEDIMPIPSQGGYGNNRANKISNQITAPDGTLTADEIEWNGTGSNPLIFQPRPGNGVYTISAFFKKGNTDGAHIYADNTAFRAAIFDLENGTTGPKHGTFSSSSIKDYGNGWFRCSATTVAIGGANFGYGPCEKEETSVTNIIPSTSDASVYVWGMQIEAGSLLTSYIPTPATSTVTRSPDLVSIEGDNFGTYRANMLNAVSPNLVIDNTGVTTSGVSVIENTSNMSVRPYSALAPDGTFSAVEMEDDDLGSTSAVRQISYHLGNVIATDKGNGPLLTNTTYTVSGYFKAGTASKAAFWLAGDDWITSYPQIWINLSDGSLLGSTTAHTNNNATVTPAGNGWYRLSLTATTNSSPPLNNIKLRVNSVNPSDTSTQLAFTGKAGSFYMWGLQIEQGTSVTPYIPSTDTFTNRQSNATFVDGNGIIRTSYANYIQNSEDFNDANYWKTESSNPVTFTLNNKVAPDGTLTAHTPSQHMPMWGALYWKSNNNTGWIVNIGSDNFNITTEWQRFSYTFQIPDNARTGQSNFRIYPLRNAEGGSYFIYSDPALTLIPEETYTYSAWYKEIDGVNHVWGVQINKGSEAGDYYKTTGTISGPPRYSHDPETLTPTGLYLEPAATNAYENSHDFSGLSGSNTNTSLTANAGTAPDGTNTAYKLSPTGTDVNRHIIEKRHDALTNSTKTGTVWVKADPDGNGRYVQFGWAKYSGQAYHLSTFDTQTGQITDQQNTGTTGGGGFLEATPYPNGWYRLRATQTDTGGSTAWCKIGLAKYPTLAASQAANPGNASLHGTQKFIGDPAEHSILIWGHQVESGTVATSYIPTSGSTVTRSADTFTSTATEVLDRANGTKPAFYTKSGISFFTQGTYTKDDLPRRFFEFKGNSASQFSLTSISNVGNPKMGLYQLNLTLTDSSGNNYTSGLGAAGSAPAGNTTSDDKFAARFEFNNSRLFRNGTGGNLDQTCDLRSSTELNIGNWHYADPTNHRFLGGTIQRLTFWKTPFTDSKLERITS